MSDRGAPVVDTNELLVQVIETGARRCKPVLKDRDVPNIPVRCEDVGHRIDSEASILEVLFGRHITTREQLGSISGTFAKVRLGNDKLVAASKKCIGHREERIFGNGADTLFRHSGRAQFVSKNVFHVLTSDLIVKVHFLPRFIGWREKVIVILFPVIDGNDLEKIGYSAEDPWGAFHLAGPPVIDALKRTIVVQHKAGFFGRGFKNTVEAEG